MVKASANKLFKDLHIIIEINDNYQGNALKCSVTYEGENSAWGEEKNPNILKNIGTTLMSKFLIKIQDISDLNYLLSNMNRKIIGI